MANHQPPTVSPRYGLTQLKDTQTQMVNDIFGTVPPPPASVTGNATADLPEDIKLAGGFDDSEMKDVQKLGDLVTAGTYAVKATRVDLRMDTFEPDPEFKVFGQQPAFSVTWTITDAGDMQKRVLFENVGWLTPEAAAALRDKNSPLHGTAKELAKARLGKWKGIKEAAGITGVADPVKVLPNLELKAVVIQASKNAKDEDGEWKPTAEKKNKITKYLSIMAQR